nr:odorant-binding protein [Odontothrips loti]
MVHASLLLPLAVLAVAFLDSSSGLPRPAPAPVTQEQYEKSVKMLRNVCQPKTNTPDDILQRMVDGEFVDDMKAFCYTACFLQTTMVLKNNKVDAKMFKKQVKKMMLEEDAQRVIAAFTACESTPVGPEPCQTTANFIRCVKEHDPTFRIPA